MSVAPGKVVNLCHLRSGHPVKSDVLLIGEHWFPAGSGFSAETGGGRPGSQEATGMWYVMLPGFIIIIIIIKHI